MNELTAFQLALVIINWPTDYEEIMWPDIENFCLEFINGRCRLNSDNIEEYISNVIEFNYKKGYNADRFKSIQEQCDFYNTKIGIFI